MTTSANEEALSLIYICCTPEGLILGLLGTVAHTIGSNANPLVSASQSQRQDADPTAREIAIVCNIQKMPWIKNLNDIPPLTSSPMNDVDSVIETGMVQIYHAPTLLLNFRPSSSGYHGDGWATWKVKMIVPSVSPLAWELSDAAISRPRSFLTATAETLTLQDSSNGPYGWKFKLTFQIVQTQTACNPAFGHCVRALLGSIRNYPSVRVQRTNFFAGFCVAAPTATCRFDCSGNRISHMEDTSRRVFCWNFAIQQISEDGWGDMQVEGSRV
ncbi:hypothetical protein B0H14DRAFT_2623022 [Mycena olivaceomarginata]|nr:hypothetical protein B0H14DRAFT_2623022 [Mycena olivaceomarginata]